MVGTVVKIKAFQKLPFDYPDSTFRPPHEGIWSVLWRQLLALQVLSTPRYPPRKEESKRKVWFFTASPQAEQ